MCQNRPQKRQFKIVIYVGHKGLRTETYNNAQKVYVDPDAIKG